MQTQEEFNAAVATIAESNQEVADCLSYLAAQVAELQAKPVQSPPQSIL